MNHRGCSAPCHAGSSFHEVPWLDGPGFTPLQMDAADSTATFKIRGTNIEVFYPRNIAGAGFGTMVVTIAGPAQAGVDTRAGRKDIGVDSYTVAAGNHTVGVSCPTAS